MPRLRQWTLSIALLATALAVCTLRADPASAQTGAKDKAGEEKDDTKEDISFETVDDVKLIGTFYKGKGTESPVAILIHRFGSDRSKWQALAKHLQANLGFAVLTFDLRGHG